jgi:DNA-binding NarL/FixJ family response regulator
VPWVEVKKVSTRREKGIEWKAIPAERLDRAHRMLESSFEPAMIAVLLLESDPWRYRGIRGFLDDSGKARVIEEPDFARILMLQSAPNDLQPDVILLSHRLVIDYGISLIPHLKDLFGSFVLVCGDHESLNVTAQLLAVGASGYFASATPEDLLEAVVAVGGGRLWGPREAVALMARRIAERKPAARRPQILDGLNRDDLTILRCLKEGLTNKEIASRLRVAEVTVKTRLTRLYKRFGVTRRLQLLSAMIRQGVLDSLESESETPSDKP